MIFSCVIYKLACSNIWKKGPKGVFTNDSLIGIRAKLLKYDCFEEKYKEI